MRLSYEVATRTYVPFHKFNGWINGDDCFTAYPADCGFPQIWERCAKHFGFEKSLGKTYDSHVFGSMNSHTFENSSGEWKLVPYVNLGLLMGSTRTSEAKIKSPLELGVKHQKLMETCPPHLRKTLTTMFLETHKEKLNTFNGPWFFPQWMGGLGLVNMEEYTNFDLHCASHAAKLAGSSPVRLGMEKEWMHYDLYDKTVQTEGCGLVTKHNFTNYAGEETFGVVFNKICWEAWLRHGLKALYDPKRSHYKQMQRSLEKRWKDVLKSAQNERNAGAFSKADPEIFTHERKESVLPVIGRKRVNRKTSE
jgi:hypothetical protein